MNKPVYLGLSIIELSKKLIYKFWYDYVKPKYGEKTKLCYISLHTEKQIIFIKTFQKMLKLVFNIDHQIELELELDRLLLQGEYKKSNWNNET